ncbi:MAG: DNA polymerase [Candidatus Daviesbacteria bacterium]|nr:DNA polymerase [Candidatus Daviesbacteria bacterium]
MKKLVLIDGNALLHRAYHATPLFTTSKGELINAAFGFSSMLLKVLEDLLPDYIAVAWDLRAPTFRHSQFANYKAHRIPMADGLASQYDRVHQIVKSFNIPEFKLPGFEADDLVGTLAKQAVRKDKSLEVVIVTGDRDIMQLIEDRIKVLMPKKTITDVGLYGTEEFTAKYGFLPINMVDYKGLAGDQSDNIPGVKGIGEVTATKLIQKYATVENVYKHLDELPERTKVLLEADSENALMSKKLATIETEIPIKLDLSKCAVHDFKKEQVIKLFTELEFKSLMPRIPGVKGVGGKESKSRAPNPKPSGVTVNLDLQVEPILKKMSETGIYIDCQFLEQFGTGLKGRLVKLEQQIYSTIGHEFNINSPKQLQDILFDELGLPVIKKTKTGRSTDEETLQQLRDAHPAIPLLLEYRQLFKIVSTYIDALPKSVGIDGRIHSTFNVEGAATGRLSSKDPNLQNIPIKGGLGSEMRKAFVAPQGKVLLGADYSQVELRILAHLADDPGLKKAFQEGIDIHALTASKIFRVSVGEVTREQRTVGKTMNFATLYGQGPHALSRQLGVDYKTAQSYIAEYFAQFSNVRDWMSKIVEEARKSGYSETIWGRRRYLPELNAPNKMLQAFGERAAVNHPIQGSSADMIKKAMVEIDKELEITSLLLEGHLAFSSRNDVVANKVKQSQSCQLILQIHDELLFECDPDSVTEVGKMVKEKMEDALKLSVPVVVEVKSGPNWGEMSPLEI